MDDELQNRMNAASRTYWKFKKRVFDNHDLSLSTKTAVLPCTRVFKRFREVHPDLVPKILTETQASKIQMPLEYMEKLPELKENPFRRRICEIFSRDGSGNMTFEDFLDLMSIFSEQAPRDLKVYYAFRIYDFDGDKYISTGDLGVALRHLTRNELTSEEQQQIAEKVVEEADVDGDGKLSYMEFEHVITRAPDFLSTFHIRI